MLSALKNAHHTLEIHRTRRNSRCHGRTQSAWGCTVCSGTWTHSWHRMCCWCTLETHRATYVHRCATLGEIIYSSASLTAASFHALVSSIGTVLIAVALPALRNAHVGSWTLERLRAAVLRFWGKRGFSWMTPEPPEFRKLGMDVKDNNYCISGLHRNRLRSRQNHHKPSVGKCSGGLHTQTGLMSKICL